MTKKIGDKIPNNQITDMHIVSKYHNGSKEGWYSKQGWYSKMAAWSAK